MGHRSRFVQSRAYPVQILQLMLDVSFRQRFLCVESNIREREYPTRKIGEPAYLHLFRYAHRSPPGALPVL